MTENRPDTDERHEPGGTPSPGRGDLTARPSVPGDDPGEGPPAAVPGAYDGDQAGDGDQRPGT